VLTDQKQVLYINKTAHHVCQKLSSKQTLNLPPTSIWKICESLINSQELHREQLFVMESEIEYEEKPLRVRVQWLCLNGFDRPCLLVRLQDQCQALQSLAIVESQNWHLTARETQVWLLRRSSLSRKQIASELYISQDTVKKHLGNVHAKRQNYLDEAAWQLEQSQTPNVLRSA